MQNILLLDHISGLKWTFEEGNKHFFSYILYIFSLNNKIKKILKLGSDPGGSWSDPPPPPLFRPGLEFGIFFLVAPLGNPLKSPEFWICAEKGSEVDPIRNSYLDLLMTNPI